VADLVERLQHALPDHYVVERELGRGGMATVYLADDRRHHREVALKVLLPELANVVGRARFLREIEIEAGLSHPGIVPLFDSGGTDEFVYYVMPYVEGETLRDRLDRERQLPFDEALRLVREVGEALAYAHARGVVHRDVKPSNILLGGARALVTDFGVARAVSVAGGEQITSAGLAVGTPAYMSPEQAAAGAVDQRSDVYALGCVLYEMLAGEPPFTGATPQAVMARARSEAPPSLEVVRPGVGRAVQSVVEKALAKVPAERWQSVAEFVAALERAAVAPESGEYLRSRGARRRVGAVVAAALLLAGAAGAALLLARRPPLDARKLVVFPLQARGDSSLRTDGAALGSLINSALEMAEPLQATDAWVWLTPAQRQDPGLITSADLERIARAQGARYALSGWVLRAGDSATVTVTLLDVRGDTTLPQVSQAGLVGPTYVAELGLRAVSGLLSRFLAPGRRVDLQLLQDHSLAAVVATVSGDLSYREAKFHRALDSYRRALQLDSTMVLAAVKGASAANWIHDPPAAKALIGVAVRSGRRAPPKYRDFTAGLQAYLDDDPDSAAASFSRAIARDSDWTEAWMARGEVHYHFLLGGWNPDSLAEADFERARALDPGFTPALYHLLEIAVRRGWSPHADTLYRALRAAGPDSSWFRKATWMVRCVRAGPDAVDWTRAASGPGGAPFDLVAVGHGLSKRQPVCAERALRAALQGAAPESLTTRWGAVVALQAILVAEGRYREVRRLLEWAVDSVHVAARSLQIVDAVDGVGSDSGAVAGLRMLGPLDGDPRGRSPDVLWWQGLWMWHHRDAARLARIVATVWDSLRVGRRDGVDTLIYRALVARLALLRADTARALALLDSLQPRGTMAALAWEWLPPLAEERLLLARLLLAKRRYAEALTVAGVFDASQPIAYSMYLPASLDVRIRAAEALGRGDLRKALGARLENLRSMGGPQQTPQRTTQRGAR
jgi:tetratricopeptide (TPR) repeat protein